MSASHVRPSGRGGREDGGSVPDAGPPPAGDVGHAVEASTRHGQDGCGEDDIPRTVHDGFFKQLFGDPRRAAAILRSITPAAVAEHLDWSALRPVQASVVHRRFRQTHGDLLFETRWKDWAGEPGGRGVPVFLRVHYEHQSSVDHWMAWRGSDTVHGIWRQWRRRNRGARYLPAVLTYVFYHGATPWRAPTSLHDLIAVPPMVREQIGEYLPSYRFLLDDIRTTSDEALRARELEPYLELALVLFKHGTTGDILERLGDCAETIVALLRESDGVDLLESLIDYLSNVNTDISEERFIRALRAVGPEVEQTMISFAQKLRQEGHDKGHEKGLEKGVDRGLRKMLLHLLTKRFDDLPADLPAQLDRASDDEIMLWAERVLDAGSLEDVFGAA